MNKQYFTVAYECELPGPRRMPALPILDGSLISVSFVWFKLKK